MRYIKHKKGFTLIEILISITIFAIVAISLANAFSSGMVNMYASGNKTRAVEEVQSYIDKVWEASENGTIHMASIDTDLKGILGNSNYCSDTSKLYISEGNEMKFHYIINENINGKNYVKVTVVVFYQSKNRNVSLTSIIPVGGI